MKRINNQTAFWEAMKEKYERRNDQLRRQELRLRQRLEELKHIMEKNQNDCDCVPEKLEIPKTSLVQCLVENAKQLLLGSCKCTSEGRLGKQNDKLLCACNVDQLPLELCPNMQSIELRQDDIRRSVEKKSSSFSLSSTDIYYMEKLKDLVKTEKEMKDQIHELRAREKNYMDSIQEYEIKSIPQSPARFDDRELQELRDENVKLKNELEDLRLEIKHCFERVEGPMKHTLENERKLREQIEIELASVKECRCSEIEDHSKELDAVKAELCTACCSIVDLTNVNSRLKTDLMNLEERYKELEEELLKQKLREAESILKFKNILVKRQVMPNDLGVLAKQYNAMPCIEALSPELVDCVNSVKNLVDMVSGKQNAFSKSASCSSAILCNNFAVQTSVQPKIVEIDNNKCCNCDASIFDMKSESCTCSIVEKTDVLDAECSCSISFNSCEVQAKQSDTEECTCTTNSCSIEVETRKTGPSEEFVAERTLYCILPDNFKSVENSCSCEIVNTSHQDHSKKMNVDTKIDILDKPPEDIHVVTTVSPSGALEVVTEGPPGLIETKVTYLENGRVEIYTQLINNTGDITKLLGGTFPVGPVMPTLQAGSQTDCTACEWMKECEGAQPAPVKDLSSAEKTMKQTINLYNLHQIVSQIKKIDRVDTDTSQVVAFTINDILDEVMNVVGDSSVSVDLDESPEATDESSEYRLARNLGATDLLRASKSLIDRRERRDEAAARPCRSAVFGDDAALVDAWDFVGEGGDRSTAPTKTLRLDDLGELMTKKCTESEENIEYKEERNSQIPTSLTYQCFFCCCDKSNDGDCPKSNLEHRIDRLLEVNPLTVPHGMECQCVDCLFYNTCASVTGCSCEHSVANLCSCAEADEGTLMNEMKIEKSRCPYNTPYPCKTEELAHGPTCTCVDCLCNPAMFQKGSQTLLISHEDQSAQPDNQDTPNENNSFFCKCKIHRSPSKMRQTFRTIQEFGETGPGEQVGAMMQVNRPSLLEQPCLSAQRQSYPLAQQTGPIRQTPQFGQMKQARLRGPRCMSQGEQIGGQPRPSVQRIQDPGKEQLQTNQISSSPRADLMHSATQADAKCIYSSKQAATKSDQLKQHTQLAQVERSQINQQQQGSPTRHQSNKEQQYQEGLIRLQSQQTIYPIMANEAQAEKSPCSCDERIKDAVLASASQLQGVQPMLISTGTGADLSGNNLPQCECAPCADLDAADKYEYEECASAQCGTSTDTQQERGCGQCQVLKEPNSWNNMCIATDVDCTCVDCQCEPCTKKKPDRREAVVEVRGEDEATQSGSSTYNLFKNICKDFFDKFCGEKSCACKPYCRCAGCRAGTHAIGNSDGEGDATHAPHIAHVLPCLVTSIRLDEQERASEATIDFLKGVDDKQMVEYPEPCHCADEQEDNRALEMVEIRNVLAEIRLTCDVAERRARPRAAPSIETTVSCLHTKLACLQRKCKDKDRIIDAMTRELRVRSESGVFDGLLSELASAHDDAPDYTRTLVCDKLPRPRRLGSRKRTSQLEPIPELDRHLIDERTYSCACEASGLEIVDVRRVTHDGLLIKWLAPHDTSGITGYHVYVNGRLVYRVLSPTRTNAVIDSLDLSDTLNVTLLAVSTQGLCEPPALATFKI